jgi:site-specific DNA recombinase
MTSNFTGRAIIYARVSTEDQADNYSIESQIAACRKYATDNGFSVVAVVQDVMTGSRLDRPGLTEVRERIQHKHADVLIVYCSDRLTRSLAHSLLLRDEFKTAGVVVHFVTKGQSQDTPEGNLFESIESAFAEYERLKIAERMARGRKAALENGKALCGHAPPFGYRYTDVGVLTVDEEEAGIVRNIYDWYLREGLGTPRIIERLAALQIASPADRREYNLKPKSKRGRGQWCTTTILHILRNEVYKGEYQFKLAGEVIVVAVPVIVDPLVWEAVAQKREGRKKFSQRNARHAYLLRGRVRCGKCGAACTGTIINGSKAWAQRYYACLRKYHTTMYIGENGRCDMPRFRCDHLEPIVWAWIDREVLNEQHIRERATLRGDTVVEERSRLEAERAVYAQQVASLDAQLTRLVELYTSGLFQMEEIAGQKGQLDAAKTSCQKEIERLDAQLEGMSSIAERVDELSALVRAIRAKVEAGLSEETKRTIIDLLDVEVLINVEEETRYADVTCHLILDRARLLVAGVVEDLNATTTDRRSGTRSSAAP